MMGKFQSDPEPTAALELEVARYGAVSKLAVVGLLLGLASFLGLLVPLLWLLAFLGAWTSIAALRLIRRQGAALTGRTVAVAGLCLSLMFGTAVPVQLIASRWWIAQQAEVFAGEWLGYLKAGQPHKAMELMGDPSSRHDVSNSGALWKHYRTDTDARRDLTAFVGDHVPRALLELGKGARLQLLDKRVEQHPSHDMITLLYAVTYRVRGEKRTFFITVQIERAPHAILRTYAMRVARYSGPVKPTLE